MTTSFTQLALLTGYMLALLIGAMGVIVVVKMAKGTINLALLVSEKDGTASLSRFQFLIFTFVIAISLLLLVLEKIESKDYNFPMVDSGVLTLLGISGGSYVVSKGIQKSFESADNSTAGGSPGQADSTGGSSKSWPTT